MKVLLSPLTLAITVRSCRAICQSEKLMKSMNQIGDELIKIRHGTNMTQYNTGERQWTNQDLDLSRQKASASRRERDAESNHRSVMNMCAT
jgi:hypothetical protein